MMKGIEGREVGDLRYEGEARERDKRQRTRRSERENEKRLEITKRKKRGSFLS